MKAQIQKCFSVLALGAVIGGFAPAAQACLGELQIDSSKVMAATPISSGRCVLELEIGVSKENQSCTEGLSAQDVMQKGVIVSADNFQCSFSKDQSFQQIVQLNSDGSITLAR